jgi:GNAT superfamily N-acetyltransferase
MVTVAQRPDLVDSLWRVPADWPAYMLEDPVAAVFYGRLATTFPEHQLLALDGDGTVVGKVHSVPFRWEGEDRELPERGWDAIIERAFADHEAGREPTAVCLLEAMVDPRLRGGGLSKEMLIAVRSNASRLGFIDVFAPIRPTGKAAEPRTSMSRYAARVRDDGLPADPWMRVHARLGARIVKVCPLSMVIAGTVQQWREWTGLALDESGDVDVDGALAPVHVSIEHDHAVYVEPNVWVHHRL